MRKLLNKSVCLLLVGLIGLSVVGCNGTTEEKDKSRVEVVKTQASKELSKNQEYYIEIEKDVSGYEYVEIELETDVNLFGTFFYKDAVSKYSEEKEEYFYIEKGQTNFSQFFDSFRKNGVGYDAYKESAINKYLLGVSFKNVSDESGNVEIKKVSVTDRKVDLFNTSELYIEKDGLKVGADISVGGTLTYLEKTDINGKTLDEVLVKDEDGNYNATCGVGLIESGNYSKTGPDGTGYKTSSNVNLINIFDAGRQFQQSFYADIGGTMSTPNSADGYQRHWANTAGGYYWPYNPVQGGDEVCNLSQLVDYKVTEDTIWIKARALDWANGSYDSTANKNKNKYEKSPNGLNETTEGGRTTMSYMENTYSIKDGMLFVTNRYVDWSGYAFSEVPHSLEVPAAYVVHPFYKYVCYKGDVAWRENVEYNSDNFDIQESLDGWASGAYVNGVNRTIYGNKIGPSTKEEWFAWLNQDDFGVGVYVPGVDRFSSGRSNPSRNVSIGINNDAKTSPMTKEFRHNRPNAVNEYTSCYTRNTSYTAPGVSVIMRGYIPMSYKYVICVDDITAIRNNFIQLNKQGEIKSFNTGKEGFKAWD